MRRIAQIYPNLKNSVDFRLFWSVLRWNFEAFTSAQSCLKPGIPTRSCANWLPGRTRANRKRHGVSSASAGHDAAPKGQQTCPKMDFEKGLVHGT